MSNDSLFMGKTKPIEYAIILVEVREMDLLKIGQFIAELRKEKNLTQERFGEMLGVTNKTVSRWETGKYLPPADILMSMSKLFDVSINEILTGQRLADTEYKATAEKNLTEAVRQSSFDRKEKMDFFKKKWRKEHIAIMILIGIGAIAVFVIGMVLRSSLLGSMAVLVLVLGLGWRNNAMMSYVEKKVYGDKQ